MMSVHTKQPVLAPAREQSDLNRLESAMLKSRQSGYPKLIGPNDEQIELPESLFKLFLQLVHDLARGKTVSIVSGSPMLTTQQAADLLNVSRPFLVKLLEQGEIPYIRTGKHRRILFTDLMAYKTRRYEESRHALNNLLQWSQDTGLYDE